MLHFLGHPVQQANIIHSTQRTPQKKSKLVQELSWSTKQTVDQGLGGGPRSERRAGRATRAWKRPVATSSTINCDTRSSFSSSFKHRHLEERDKEGEVSVGEDDYCQEGGEAAMEDVGTRPEQFEGGGGPQSVF